MIEKIDESDELFEMSELDIMIYQELAEKTFRITHRYDLINRDIYVERVSGDVDPRRAAIYCQFWAEEWYTQNPNNVILVSNFGIAAMLIRFYGFAYVNGGVKDSQTIDMFEDRERACGPDVNLLFNDPSLAREGLKEAIYHFIDSGLEDLDNIEE